jgi:HK97 family phage prohead protease
VNLTLEQRTERATGLSRLVERRSFARIEPLEERDDSASYLFRGYACVVEKSYDMRWYDETIAAGAFDKTLRERPDVMFLVNHEGLPLARTKTGDLRLSVDTTGLLTEADLAKDDIDVQRIAPKMRRGLMDEMSFAFRVMRQEWNEDYTERYITELSLEKGDVSLVNYGANPATAGATLRSLDQILPRLDDLHIDERRALLATLQLSIAEWDEDEAGETDETDASDDGKLAADPRLELARRQLAVIQQRSRALSRTR